MNTISSSESTRNLLLSFVHWFCIATTTTTTTTTILRLPLQLLVHRCLLGKVPVYLSNCCIPVAQVPIRWHLRSAARHQLTVPRHRLSTFGRRAFTVASPTMFNALPDDLRDPAVSITFGQSMKTHLFFCLSARLAH